MSRRTNAAAGPSLPWPQSRAFSARLRPLIGERRLSQADVALGIGLGQPALSLLLAGARWRERDAARAAEFLGTTVAALLGDGAP